MSLSMKPNVYHLEQIDELYDTIPNAWSSRGVVPTDNKYSKAVRGGVDDNSTADKLITEYTTNEHAGSKYYNKLHI